MERLPNSLFACIYLTVIPKEEFVKGRISSCQVATARGFLFLLEGGAILDACKLPHGELQCAKIFACQNNLRVKQQKKTFHPRVFSVILYSSCNAKMPSTTAACTLISLGAARLSLVLLLWLMFGYSVQMELCKLDVQDSWLESTAILLHSKVSFSQHWHISQISLIFVYCDHKNHS